MKTHTILMFLIVTFGLFFHIGFSQELGPKYLFFKLDNKPIPVVDRIICRDNNIVTVVLDPTRYNTNENLKIKKNLIEDGDIVIIECIKNASNKDFAFEQKPVVKEDKNGDNYNFKISNFKPGNLYNFQIVLIKNPTVTKKISNTLNTTLKNIEVHSNGIDTSDIVDSGVLQIDTNFSNQRMVIRDFVVEAREMNSLVINIGVYYSPARLLNYSLLSDPNSKTIVENGPKSSQGIMLGATFFLKGHDEKSFFDNPNINCFEEICRNIGLYVGVAFSSQNKGIDNILIGGNFAFRSANVIMGVNLVKSQYLKSGYNVGDKYTGADINSILSSKTIGHLFFGASVNSSLILSVLGLLTSLAGIK